MLLGLELASDYLFVLVLATHLVLELVLEVHVFLTLLEEKLEAAESLLHAAVGATAQVATVRGSKGLQAELDLFNFDGQRVLHGEVVVNHLLGSFILSQFFLRSEVF